MMICLNDMVQTHGEKFGKRDFNKEISKAIFALEVLAVQANELYYNSSKESFLSDSQYDNLTEAIAKLYQSIGMERNSKDFGYQFHKPDIHNKVDMKTGECKEEDMFS